MTRCNRGYVRFGMEVVPLRQDHIIVVMVDYMMTYTLLLNANVLGKIGERGEK